MVYEIELHGIMFYFNCLERMDRAVQKLLCCLDDIPVEKIRDGYTFRVNFTRYVLTKNNTGYYVAATDYSDPDPMTAFTLDLTDALEIEIMQSMLCDEFGVDRYDISDETMVGVYPDALTSPHVTIFNVAIDDKRCVRAIVKIDEYDDSRLVDFSEIGESVNIPAGKLYKYNKLLVYGLSIPPDYTFVIKNNKVDSMVNDKNEVIKYTWREGMDYDPDGWM